MTNVLIPAYMPDERLITMTRSLLESYRVVVVDDGSGSEYQHIFSALTALGVVVLTHPVNLGKGCALKTGIKWISENDGDGGVITADSDGQHALGDIDAIANALSDHSNAIILGVRKLTAMPLRSRAGNTITRLAFRFVTGLNISDTQTGLRGLPSCLYDKLLALDGNRYEYEMNMLLSLNDWRTGFVEVPIQTIYIDNNSGTHFHSLRDGVLVFSRIFRFCASSLACTAVDYLIYTLLLAWLAPAAAYVLARIASACLNYQLNRRVVFHRGGSVKSALSYAVLVLIVMALGSGGVTLICSFGVNKIVSKLIMDLILFILSFTMQRKFVFSGRASTEH